MSGSHASVVAAGSAAGAAPDPAAPPPRFALRALTRLAERANPMLVRVVRQELRNRAFIGIFSLLLVGAGIAAVVAAAMSDGDLEGRVSQGFFAVIAWFWAFSLMVVQPLTVFRAVSTERNDDTWDLVELTGMRPMRILRGLLMASLVQSMLYTSALAPFMVMAYLLRGLAISHIVLVLMLVPLGGIAASSLAAFCACLGRNRAWRGLLGGLLALGLLGAWCPLIAVFHPSGMGEFSGELLSWDAEAWYALLALINLWAGATVLLNVLSAALLTFRAANRSTGPRLTWMALWLNTLAWFVVLPCLPDTHVRLGDSLAVFGVVGAIACLLLGFFSVTEDLELSPRQARSLAGARWRRSAMLLLGPGAARGRLAFVALATLTVAVIVLGAVTESSREAIGISAAALGVIAYGAVLLALGDRCARLGFLPQSPQIRRMVLLVITAIATLVPPLAAVLIGMVDGKGFDQGSLVLMLGPVGGIAQLADPDEGHSLRLIVVLLVGAAALAVLGIQGFRLRVVTRQVVATAIDRDPRGG